MSQGYLVLIRTNFCSSQQGFLGGDSILYTIVHGSVIRPLKAHANMAIGSADKIKIADIPLETPGFAYIMNFTSV